MVANMRVGNMDGFCVGEPWNNRAIMDKIGFTAVTTRDIWTDHPEKVLGTTRRFRGQISQHRIAMDVRHHSRPPLDRRRRKTVARRRRRSPQKVCQHRADAVIVRRMPAPLLNGLGKT